MAPPAASAALRAGRARARAPSRSRSRSRPRPPRLRRLAVAALVMSAALAAGYILWLRNSSLVAVEDVRVVGASTQAAEISRVLERAAGDMTTLNVDADALERAVAGYPTVRSISVDTDLPHGLTIEVAEWPAVATIGEGEGAVAVSANGELLAGVPTAELRLPQLEVGDGASAGRLEGGALEQARVLGAAPAPLAPALEAASKGDEGVEVGLTGGITLIFGDAREAGLKWRTAAAVLADPALDALEYIDLRVPQRPAVGGDPRALEPVEPAADGAAPAIDPTTGAPLPADAATEGAPVDPATGVAPVDPATGAPVDPATGAPVDPATGAPPLDPATAVAPADPTAVAPEEGGVAVP